MVQSPLRFSAARFFTANRSTQDAKTKYARVRRILINHLLIAYVEGSLWRRPPSAVQAWAKPRASKHGNCSSSLEISLRIQNPQLPKLNQFLQSQILEPMLLRPLDELRRNILHFGADDVVDPRTCILPIAMP